MEQEPVGVDKQNIMNEAQNKGYTVNCEQNILMFKCKSTEEVDTIQKWLDHKYTKIPFSYGYVYPSREAKGKKIAENKKEPEKKEIKEINKQYEKVEEVNENGNFEQLTFQF